MRHLGFILALLALIAGCGSDFDQSLNHVETPVEASGNDKLVTFRFDLLARESRLQIPESVTSLQFLCRDDNLNVVQTVQETRKEELKFRAPKDVSVVEVRVMVGDITIRSGLFSVPGPRDVLITDPGLDPVPFPGAVGLTLEPANSRISLDSVVEFHTFLTGQTGRVDATDYVTLDSSDTAVFFFPDPKIGNVGQAGRAGQSVISAVYEAPAPQLVLGRAHGVSRIRVVDASNWVQGDLAEFFAFDPSFSGGVTLATGDVDGDGRSEVICGGRRDSTRVRVIDAAQTKLITDFAAFGEEVTGGVTVASGDVDSDGKDDIVTGAGTGGKGKVRVYEGLTGKLKSEFSAFEPGYPSSVNVAAADVNGDGFCDIVVGSGAGAPPTVKVFDGRSGGQLFNFQAYDQAFKGGVTVAAGDVSGDGTPDIITGPGAGLTPEVRIFNGETAAQIGNFFAFTLDYTGGVNLASGDLDGDGRAEIAAAPVDVGISRVRVFTGTRGEVLSEVPVTEQGVSLAVFPREDSSDVLTSEAVVEVGGGSL